MASLFISYNGYEFHSNGRPHYTRSTRSETDAPGTAARREIVTYGIQQIFREHTFGDNQAKYWDMLKAIRDAPEGRLLIKDEFNNPLVDVLAKPESSSLPDQWGQWMTEVTVTFTSIEVVSDGATATIRSQAGSLCHLQNVTAWREAARIERPTTALNNRRETTGTVTAAGKIMANPQATEAERRTELQTVKAAIVALADSKESQLVFGAFDRVVRVDSADADIKDGSYEMEWSLSASYRRFPDGSFTEAEYEVGTRDDLERGERIMSVKGKVRGSTIEEAKTRVATIIASYHAQGRALLRSEMTEQLLDGPDSVAGPENYGEVAFTSEFRELLAAVTATIKSSAGVTTKLLNVLAWRESVRTERSTFALNNRRETTGTVTAAGKIVAKQKGTTDAQRRLELQKAKAAIVALADSKESQLVFGAFNRVVRVDSADADIKDGSYEMEWSLSASYRRFPEGSYTEAEYEVGTRDDIERGERITSVHGKVRGSTIEEAKDRVATIIASYRASGRSLRRSEMTEQLLDGPDSVAGPENYGEVAFTSEFRELLTAINWTLSISSKKDIKAGQILTTYSGKVTGGTAGSALDQARRLGLSTAPGILMGSTETISSSRLGDEEVQVTEVDFSYEYLMKGTWTFAQVTSETNVETFGPSTTVVSGSCTASTQAIALALARGFRPSAGLKLSQRESFQTMEKDADGVIFDRCDFSYTYRLAPENGAIEYAHQVSNDFQSREQTETWSGTAYGPDEGTAQGLINGVIPLNPPGRHLRKERTVNRKKSAGGDLATSGDFLVSITFALSFAVPMPHGDDDILEAESTMSITYSVNHAVITPIPFGVPHVQTNCGWTPAVKSVSANVVALNENSARVWGRALREAIGGEGAAPDAPEERMTTTYYPMSGTQVKAYRFSATYAARFASIPLV